MTRHLKSIAACAALLLAPLASHAAPVEYVRVCSVFGAGFSYLPGTDICINASTGDTRVVTEGGVWRSILPYPEGEWVKTPQQQCTGRVETLGTFSASDFTTNAWNRKQTSPIPLALSRNEFISKVIMSGGFLDPRLPNRHATNALDGLCVRSVDPTVMENTGGGVINPPFGNGMLPIGCVSNSRILGMPASYSINATSAYPSIDSFYFDGAQTTVSGPYTYGSKLVVTTDFGNAIQQLNYFDQRTASLQPLAGNVTVSVCVQKGKNER